MADVCDMSANRTWLRWSFSAVGLALWVLPSAMLKYMLPVYAWAAHQYFENPAARVKVMLTVVLGMAVTGALC